MRTIDEILSLPTAEDTISELKYKTVSVPAWDKLEREYNPK